MRSWAKKNAWNCRCKFTVIQKSILSTTTNTPTLLIRHRSHKQCASESHIVIHWANKQLCSSKIECPHASIMVRVCVCLVRPQCAWAPHTVRPVSSCNRTARITHLNKRSGRQNEEFAVWSQPTEAGEHVGACTESEDPICRREPVQIQQISYYSRPCSPSFMLRVGSGRFSAQFSNRTHLLFLRSFRPMQYSFDRHALKYGKKWQNTNKLFSPAKEKRKTRKQFGIQQNPLGSNAQIKRLQYLFCVCVCVAHAVHNIFMIVVIIVEDGRQIHWFRAR